MTPQEDHSNDDALAGEYALHLLDAEERQAFEDRMVTDSRLLERVRDWDHHFAAMAESFTPVVPSSDIKVRIDDRLFGTAGDKPGSRWRWFTSFGLGATVALIAIIAVLSFVNPPPAEPAFTAQVAAEDASLVVVANYFPQTGRLQIDRLVGAAADGRALELWLIAEGASAPVSLGLLSADAVTALQVNSSLAPQIAGATLAISDEPSGGSPTGAPTGDVLAVGQVSEI
ncbi:anti-sigma factor [Sulfitobacter sp. F26204]|uniref:anti-sigma factor n=1 Tax=Sulfitobacter sp. F26204 TaxID=2996014 RepID=UPI00225E0DA2|nr:anti-sigma factor [Sulfitobacter sp. F26204]MCX7560535.1 anti-sigma factor [Sulfitobacter sp. F26204]